jgi:hypothetical protein
LQYNFYFFQFDFTCQCDKIKQNKKKEKRTRKDDVSEKCQLSECEYIKWILENKTGYGKKYYRPCRV